MTASEKLYQQLFSSFSEGKLEDYDWFEDGFIVIDNNSGDLYYLSDDKKAFHLLNGSGLLQCFHPEDFVDIPIKEYLRGMTYEDIMSPVSWNIETTPKSIRLLWRTETDERVDYANFNLEDNDEPYLNNDMYGCFTGDKYFEIESHKFPYPVYVDLEVELTNDGLITSGPKLYITRMVDGDKLMYIRATYSYSDGVNDIQKLSSSDFINLI